MGVSLVGGLSAWSGLPMLMAPLGPTALLIFAQPGSPTAQPISVFGGYFIGAVVASILEVMFPGLWWVATISVGIVMLAMLMLRVTHPPAAAVPLVVFSGPIPPIVLFGVMLAACVVLTALAILWHALPPRIAYPKWLED
ncbi:hypothetical protein GCM10007989_21690 [Devosia pacifica]|uniref:HPP transmembrane region domain-containing protein n=1 Tax=Devosia pacifica TaxID=1335967 RepID=A0A918VU47_9HYPH|nr:hypothetical protein GCM10007989_21690 [Devosia pacifica]